jgi:23S rRNA pseudouridine2605 synthase
MPRAYAYASAVRLATYLAHAGVASRRAAAELVRAGRVRVDGERELDPARQVEGELIEVDGRALAGPEERVTYAVHKPLGVVSTASDTHGRPTIVNLVEDPRRLYPVGRLDVDTTGLILVTNDGELANLLLHPRHEVPRRYRARVSGGRPGRAALATLRDGVELDDGPTAPASVALVAPDTIELEIHEGRKRQVRRMCAAVGHPVVSLVRIAFGPLELGDLDPGGHRRLSADEVALLRGAAE